MHKWRVVIKTFKIAKNFGLLCQIMVLQCCTVNRGSRTALRKTNSSSQGMTCRGGRRSSNWSLAIRNNYARDEVVLFASLRGAYGSRKKHGAVVVSRWVVRCGVFGKQCIDVSVGTTCIQLSNYIYLCQLEYIRQCWANKWNIMQKTFPISLVGQMSNGAHGVIVLSAGREYLTIIPSNQVDEEISHMPRVSTHGFTVVVMNGQLIDQSINITLMR